MNELIRALQEMKKEGKKNNEKQMNLGSFSNVSHHHPKDIITRYSRIQSPSSINTFLQCPRNYYYKYVLEIPTKPTLDQFRGKLLHSILEHLFEINPEIFSKSNFAFELKMILLEQLKKQWALAADELDKINATQDRIKAYYYDSERMLSNFAATFEQRMNLLLKKYSFKEAFRILTPKREKYLESERYKVRGFIDTIFEDENKKIVILDYKTAASDIIKDAYKNQLSIYALLYRENYNKIPHEVGIHFLMHGIKTLTVDSYMLKHAVSIIKKVHKGTLSKEIKDYPKVKSGLCKWHSGQCDFYDLCYGNSN